MINYLLAFVLFYLFFSYALTSIQILFAITLGIVFIIFILKYPRKIITIHIEDTIFILCTVVNMIGIVKTTNIVDSIIFTAIILCLTLLRFALSNLTSWKKLFIRYSFIFSLIHVIATIIQLLIPSIIMKFNTYILAAQSYRVNYSQLIRGKYAGITGQVGTNAFFITIFIAIIFCWCIEVKEKRKKYIGIGLFFIGVIAILLTGKRGLLLFNISTIVLILIIKSIKNKKHVLNVFLLIVVGSVISVGGIYVIQNISTISKYIVDQDVTSGRIDIYASVFEMIKNSPYIGNGLYSVESIVGIKAHNIYLQLWAELGIIGLVIYCYTIAITLYNSIKIYINYTEKRFYTLLSIYIQLIFISYGLSGNPLYDYFILGIYIIATALPRSVQRDRN